MRRAGSRCSLRGRIAREAIRVAVRFPFLKNGGVFLLGARLAERRSRWAAPKGYRLLRVTENGLPMECLERKTGGRDCAILQLHGGAYLAGYSDLHRAYALRYAQLSEGASVLSVDYRIAPENPYPAALQDALAAWDWLLGRGFREERIILAGDSAGGNLALALTIRLRDGGRLLPNALVLMSPWADMTGRGFSRSYNFDKDPLFGRSAGDGGKDDKRAPGNPYAGCADLCDCHLSPVFADFSRFPPMLIQVGAWEMLLSEARTVAHRARQTGVPVTLTEYPGMFHSFQSFFDKLPESRRAWGEAGAFIAERLP